MRDLTSNYDQQIAICQRGIEDLKQEILIKDNDNDQNKANLFQILMNNIYYFNENHKNSFENLANENFNHIAVSDCKRMLIEN